MQPVRLGIIGCGVIGRRHLEAAADSTAINVVAVADLREGVARQMAGKYGVETVYARGDDLLEDGRVEAVVLAMPACIRTGLGLRAFERGKHVLTEKPVAMNADEVRQLIRARGDLVAGCCSSRYRFLPSADAVTAFLATGALGALRMVQCRAIRPGSGPPQTPPPEWRLKVKLNGGGIMSNWGCYDLDYLLGVTGWSLRPKLVLGQTWTVPPKFEALTAPGSDAETHAAAIVRCEGGAVIHFERGEMTAARAEDAWKIVGTEGSLELDMLVKKGKRIVYNRASSEEGVVSETIWEGDEDSGLVHAGPVEDFALAIRENRRPRTGLEEALVVQQITDAIYRSAKEERAVEIG